MNSRERYEMYSRFEWYKNTPEEIITNLVSLLIEALYIPVKEFDGITRVDDARLKHFGISVEPINWGDLKCNEVNRFEDGSYLVTIDEASPNHCPTFCEYIEAYIASYGWKIKAQTEW